MPRSGQPWDGEFFRKSPLFRVYEPFLARWAGKSAWPSLEEYAALMEEERARRAPELRELRPWAMRKKPRRWRRTTPIELAELYDGSIELAGQVPCLAESYHDLWNAVVFAAFPRAKRALHARQYRALVDWVPRRAERLPSRRTREQDALTVFDEGGSVVVLETARYREWLGAQERVEIAPHPDTRTAPVVFGHALLELAQYGLPKVRSGAVVFDAAEIPSGRELFEHIDVRLAERLTDPARFRAPGADAVLELDETGRLWLGPATGPEVAFASSVGGCSGGGSTVEGAERNPEPKSPRH